MTPKHTAIIRRHKYPHEYRGWILEYDSPQWTSDRLDAAPVPLEMLVSTLAQITTVKRKATVNRDDCFEAMIANDIYPLGLSRREIKILQLCKLRQDKAGLATEFKVNAKELTEDFGTLRQAGFVTTKGSFLSTSVLGAAYLQQAKEKGFKF